MKCRICGKDIKESVFSLGEQPASNSYLHIKKIKEEKYPLDLFFCDHCKFLQIDEIVKASDVFVDDYPYLSSCSSSWAEHCRKYAENVVDRFNLDSNSYVMEIASNDGCLLEQFMDRNIKVKGVEPSSGVANIAIKSGIDTDVEFFGTSYAKKMHESGHAPQLIIANNVIAHNPNVIDFIEGVRILLAKGGVFTVEFPHLYNLIKYKQFDTIYHEHYSYFSLKSISVLLNKCGLTLFDVEKIPTHGGSLRIYAGRSHDSLENIKTEKIMGIMTEEECGGLYSKKTYEKFYKDIKSIKVYTLNFLLNQLFKKKRVVGYGAPAKGNTFLNYCGIDTGFIEYTVDRSDYKIGKKLPGSHIPIYSIDKILDDDPDYIFILPWNIKDEIIAFLGKDKAKFVTAIPELKIS